MIKQRIFVAIDVPEKLKNVAGGYLESFYKNKLARVVEKENLHITIVFCGYLNDEGLKKLKEKTKKISGETKSFELIPDKIIFAPLKRTPRMVWLIFKYSPEFLKLSRGFSEFNQDEFNQEKREQIPHLNLVRFKEVHYSELKKFLPEEGVILKNKTEPFLVELVSIMESHLSPSGPKYKLICRNCLK